MPFGSKYFHLVLCVLPHVSRCFTTILKQRKAKFKLKEFQLNHSLNTS